MQSAFVTGATGFLGAHLVCELLQKGYHVTALKRPQSSINEFNFISGLYFGQDQTLVAKNLNWVDGNITHYDSLVNLIESYHIVFHCAALVSFYKKDSSLLYLTNVKGTENIVNACLVKECQKLVHVSSTAAIGNLAEPLLTTETAEWDEKDNPSNYSRSKFYAELEVWRGIEEGLNAVIVNPPIILGPCDWSKSTGRFFINANKNFPFYTTGSNAFVYVKDVAVAMIQLAETDINSERFLIVSENLGYYDLMCLISDAFGKKRPHIKVSSLMTGIAWRWFAFISFFTGRRGLITQESAASSIKNISYSNKKLIDTISFSFTPLKKAITETVATYNH